MATLPHDGREIIKWPTTAAPGGVSFEAQFSTAEDGAWVPVSFDGTHITALLAGPDVEPGDEVATLPLGRTWVRFRVVDNPEVVVRGGGTIDVK